MSPTFTASQVGEMIGIDPKVIRDWRYAGHLPFEESDRPEGQHPTFIIDQVLKLAVMVDLGALGLSPSDTSPLAARAPAIEQIDKLDAELWVGAFTHAQSGATPFVGRIDQMPTDGSVVAMQVVNATAALGRIRARMSDAIEQQAPPY